MEKIIATVSFSAPIERTLESIARAGFTGVELLFNDLEQFSGTNLQFKQLCEDLGLKIVALQPMRSFEGTRNWAKKMDEAKSAFQSMNEIGVDLTVLCSNVSADCRFEPSLWVHQLRELSELASEYGVRIGYEALSWGTFINRFEAAASIVNRVDHHAFGITLDSFHTFALSNDITNLQNLDASKVFLVQLADAKRLGLDLLSWSRNHRCFPGLGDFEVASFLSSIIRTGYVGPFSLEVFSKKLRESDPLEVAKMAFNALEGLEEAIEQEKTLSFAASG